MKVKDFIVKTEDLTRKKKGKREYLNNQLTSEMMKQLNKIFEVNVEIPRMKVGNKQTIETLINEEALYLAKFLINKSGYWIPRITGFDYD